MFCTKKAGCCAMLGSDAGVCNGIAKSLEWRTEPTGSLPDPSVARRLRTTALWPAFCLSFPDQADKQKTPFQYTLMLSHSEHKFYQKVKAWIST